MSSNKLRRDPIGSDPKRTTGSEVDKYCPITEDSDLVKVLKAFSDTSNSPRSFRAVQTNFDGSALAVEITTPR